MILPLSVQGADTTCSGMDLLKSAKDTGLQSAVLELKAKGGGCEDLPLNAKNPFLYGWPASASEGSLSSIDSLPGGESLFSPSDYHASLIRRQRAGVHLSESLLMSDDEVVPDLLDEAYAEGKSKVGAGGLTATGSVSMEEAASDQPSEDNPCARVKFMCSFGGKILPRPIDGNLRYVGGETRIISVPRDISYSDLMFKVTEFYGHALTLKYQLPREELDALVSVSSDEDLENMMEEYDKIEASDPSPRLRVFLFGAAEYDVSSLGEQLGYFKDHEQQYVDAVNGLSRKQSEGGLSSGGQAVENLLDVDGPWVRDPVPVALLAPQLSQDYLHHVPVAVPVVQLPVSSYHSIPPATSAPNSTPSSPPAASRPSHNLPPVVTDVMYQEQHVMPGGRVYTALVAGEGGYQDLDMYASSAAASTSASGHDAHFRPVDSRRAPESPPKSQLMPRPGSYGKLSDNERGIRLEHMDVHTLPPVDLQRMALQQSWQLPTDGDTLRRADLHVHDAVAPQVHHGPAFGQKPQLQTSQFRPGAIGHDSLFWQMDQQTQPQQSEDLYSGHHMHRSISAHAIAQSALPASAPYQQTGSTPSSPRMGFREVSARHIGVPQQQLQLHRQYVVPEVQYGRLMHTYNDPSSRTVAGSPPRHREREHMAAPADVLRQHQLASSTSGVSAAVLSAELAAHDQVATKPAPVSQSMFSEIHPRSGVPQFVVLNPLQEGVLPFQDLQDLGERRHILPIGRDTLAAPAGQSSHFLHSFPNQRVDYQDLYVPPMEQASVLARYTDAEWAAQRRDSDDRVWSSGRTRAGPSNYKDDNMDFGVGQSVPFSNFQFPSDADALLRQEPYLPSQPRTERPESSMANVQSRVGTFPSVSMPAFSKGKGAPVESSHPQHEVQGKAGDADHEVSSAVTRSLLGIADLRGPVGHPVPASQSAPLLNTESLLDEQLTGLPFTQGQPHVLNADVGLSPIFTTGVAVLSDPQHGGGTAPEAAPGLYRPSHAGMYAEDHFQSVPNLLDDELGGRLEINNSSMALDEVLENTARIPELSSVFTQANGSLLDDAKFSSYLHNGLSCSDETLTSNFPVSPLAAINVPPSLGGQSGVQLNVSCASNDRAAHALRSGSSYKPSPLGMQSSITDVFSLGEGLRAPTEGLSEDINTESESPLSGAARVAEDMVAAVLASRDQPPYHAVLSHRQEVVSKRDKLAPPIPVVVPTVPLAAEGLPSDAKEVKDSISADVRKDEPGASVPQAESVAPKKLIEGVEELKIVEPTEETDELSSPVEDNAANAKVEAIARGLQTIHNADLEELRELGSGTFGTVYHGKWRGSDVAIKRIKASCFAGRPSEQERLRADFWREACTLSQLHHPNVVAFYGVVPDGPGGTLATVTEYMVNGSMKQVMQKKDRTIDRRKRLLIAMDAAFGMEYLHTKNLVHFDLKCENLLVNMRDPQRPICKVGDLGLSKVKHATMVSGGVRGTLPWMAPELLNGRTAMVTDKVDVYSFGIVMWELLTGEEPYANMHYGAIIGGIVNDSLRPDIPHWCEPAWRNLMERCWAADPGVRPSFSDIASELRTMSASHPKAHGHGHQQGQSQTAVVHTKAHGHGHAHGQAQGQAQGQISPPRAL